VSDFPSPIRSRIRPLTSLSSFPGFDPYAGSRAGSVAADLNGTEAGDSLQLTPRAAAAVNAREAAQTKQPAKKRQKAIAIDKVIELDWQAARLAGKARFKEVRDVPLLWY